MNQGLGSWVQRRALKSGSDVALLFGGDRLTYGEFARRVDALAGALAHAGVSRGDRVAYLGENHPSFLESLFATATLGAIFVPLNTRLSVPELRYILEDSGPTALISSARLSEVAAGASSGLPIPVRLLAAGDGSGGIRSLDDVIRESSPLGHEIAVGLDEPAMILYTSGTTGRPRGAVLTHGNLTWNALNVVVDYDIASTDRALMVSPLFHVASLGMGALPAFLKGATVVLEERFDPAVALHLIEGERITWMSGVPTTFQMMSEHLAWDATDLSSLAKLTCGGSSIPRSVVEAFEARGLRFTGGYGMTEAGPGVTSLSAPHALERSGSVGLPHFFTSFRIVDEAGRPVGAGEIGEIEIQGPNVIDRYWRIDPATGSAHRDGWFPTGDLGRIDDDGFLYVVDRLKDMIISGGENIYCAEVEAAILELEAVDSVAVIGVPNEKWGEVPLAIVALHDGFDLDYASLRSHLEGRIARFKIPTSLVVIDEMPRTASGKITKNALREKYGHPA